jgi:hypothetical protein
MLLDVSTKLVSIKRLIEAPYKRNTFEWILNTLIKDDNKGIIATNIIALFSNP